MTERMEAIDRGARSLVKEGAEALKWVPEGKTTRCVVKHPDAGGPCPRTATMEVYGLALCSEHGAEAKMGALGELYDDAANFLGVLENPHLPSDHPLALGVVGAVVNELTDRIHEVEKDLDETLRRTYPFIPERVCIETRNHDYDDPHSAYFPPYDRFRDDRHLVCKLMRLAWQEGATWLVERLEEDRETVSAQTAFALADRERRAGSTTR